MATKKVKMTETPAFNFEDFQKEAIAGLFGGKNLGGEDGVLAPLVQHLLNSALKGEAKGHVQQDKSQGIKNRLNGTTNKRVKTQYGEVDITPPRDRNGTFEPQLLGKWDRKLGTGLNEQILYLYALGNSYSDIQHQLKMLYGIEMSAGTITAITDEVYSELSAWQNRRLESMYTVLFLDGIFFTSREENVSKKRVIYSVYGINCEGQRDVLGIYIRNVEAASEWASILNDIKRRGVEDVLFVCVDGLAGFKDAIEQVFPMSLVQRCIVHMVRNCTKFVAEKDIKKVCKDLREIYQAVDITQAEIALESFKEKWDEKYPDISKAWDKDWTELTNFMGFSEHIRRIIYTTNAVEALHRQIRKVTKTKGSWTTDKSLLKQIYLILTYGKGGWKRDVFGWKIMSKELQEKFGDRYEKHLML